MSKYAPLGEFLRAQKRQEVPLTFAEIERITGVALPPKAQHHRAWWSNNPSNNVMTKVWLEAGYETEQVDMASRKLVFRRHEASAQPEPAARLKSSRPHHPLQGILKDVTHVPAGVDLTQPADPEWGKAYSR